MLVSWLEHPSFVSLAGPGRFWTGPETRSTILGKVQPTVIIQLAPTRRILPENLKWATELPRVHPAPGFWFRPMSDGRLRNQDYGDWLSLAADVAGMVTEGHRVYAHCLAGRNRSPLLAGLVLMILARLTGAQARSIVTERRPGALINPHFHRWLGGLEAFRETD